MRTRPGRSSATARAGGFSSGCETPSAETLPDRPAPWDEEGLTGDGAWLELSVEADLEAVDAVGEILSRYASGGTSVEPAFELVDDGLGARVDPARPAIVRAYLPALDRAAARAAIAGARVALGHLQAFGLRLIGDLDVTIVHESDWAEAWKRYFPVLRVGRRIVIRPTWRRHRRLPGDVVLALDPGMAFGTGLHPTTRLCLEGIERWADEGLLPGGAPSARLVSVLDVGCGSGILAIATARLGAGRVLGVDTDPIAVEATLANARRNRLVRRVVARRGSVPTGDREGFDLVVANLIASLLVSLAGSLNAELVPGGRLLASGIFIDREDDVRAALGDTGLIVGGRWCDGDWVALEARRAA
jgi:ribosomal protein L11 methyltransferase